MAGTGMTSPLLVPPACSLCCLFPGGNPLEVFRAGYVSCSCTEDLSPYIVVNFLAKWPLHIIFFLCIASVVSGVLPTWSSVRAALYVFPTVPKAALKEMHHVPDSSLPLHPFLRNYLKVSLIFRLFCSVWCLPFIFHWILKVRKMYVA